ncbi:hypothetical protein BC943DRAFT_360358 [Umbelopsis sp. AD052]|nr:hypothetical protein BC943DRAFT_360358 [Umbelopsis sp. AD052]
MAEERFRSTDVETWKSWNRFTKDIKSPSVDKPLPNYLGISIDEEKVNYRVDRSLMASRWAVSTSLYPPELQSIDDSTAEWLENGERPEEDCDISAEAEMEQIVITRYTREEIMEFNPVMNWSWVCVESIDTLNAALSHHKLLDRHTPEEPEYKDEEL